MNAATEIKKGLDRIATNHGGAAAVYALEMTLLDSLQRKMAAKGIDASDMSETEVSIFVERMLVALRDA